VATVHVERATSEMAVFDGELPLSERQLARLAEQLAKQVKADMSSERERRAERSLGRNSVLSGQRGCGG
jgi:chromosome segregation and condensation protein ScpB